MSHSTFQAVVTRILWSTGRAQSAGEEIQPVRIQLYSSFFKALKMIVETLVLKIGSFF